MFRIAVQALGVLILAFMGACLCLSVYMYTGPHPLPKLAHYLEEESRRSLPENSLLKIGNIELGSERGLTMRVSGFQFHKSHLWNLRLDQVEFSIDFLGFVPGLDRSILNVNIKSPYLEIEQQAREQTSKIETQENNMDSAAIANLRSFLNAYGSKLRKIKIYLKQTVLEIRKSDKSVKIPIEIFTIHPVLAKDEFSIRLKGKFPLHEKILNIDTEVDLVQSKDALKISSKLQFPPELQLNSDFEVDLSDKGLSGTGRLSLSKLNLEHIQDLWPSAFKPETRDQISKHLPKGNIAIIEDLKAEIVLDKESLKMEIKDAKILKNTTFSSKASISDWNAKKLLLNFEGATHGSLKDLVELGLAYAPKNEIKIEAIKGIEKTTFSATIPLNEKKVGLKNIDFRLNSDIDQIEAPHLYEKHGLTNGKINTHIKNGVAKIDGIIFIDKLIPLRLYGNANLLTKDNRVSLKSKVKWKSISDMGIKIPKAISGAFELTLYRSQYGKQENTVLDINLKKTVLAKTHGISKEMTEEGKITLDLERGGKRNPVLRYDIQIGGHKTQGVGVFSKDFGKEFEMSFSKIKLTGPKKYVEMEFHYRGKKFHLKTNNLRSLLSFFDITDRIANGSLDFEGTMDADDFKGKLSLETFEVKKIPILLKILALGAVTLTSLKEAVSVLEGKKGMEFSILTNTFTYAYQKKQLTMHRLVVGGNVLHGAIEGELFLKNKPSAKISGIVVPAKLINSTPENILTIGTKKGPHLAVQFKLNGPLEDPKISVDFLNILTMKSFIRLKTK